jgi:hypothetical protein
MMAVNAGLQQRQQLHDCGGGATAAVAATAQWQQR